MFCEHCGCSLEEDAKFCTSCGATTVDTTKPTAAVEMTAEEAWTCEMHREYFWEYLGKGAIGFVIGAIFGIGYGPVGALVLGLYFAGIPYGWNLITRLTGGWTLYGIIAIVLYYLLKLFFSVLIGFTVYPPLLLYHLMMSQKPRSTAQGICLVALLLSVVASFLLIFQLMTSR